MRNYISKAHRGLIPLSTAAIIIPILFFGFLSERPPKELDRSPSEIALISSLLAGGLILVGFLLLLLGIYLSQYLNASLEGRLTQSTRDNYLAIIYSLAYLLIYSLVVLPSVPIIWLVGYSTSVWASVIIFTISSAMILMAILRPLQRLINEDLETEKRKE